MRFLVSILVSVAILITTGFKVTRAEDVDGNEKSGSSADTLKALGLLVERNKVSNNALSVKFARMALDVANQTGSSNDLVDAYKWLGKAFLQSEKDSSYYYLALALRIADSLNMSSQKVHIFYNLASFHNAAYNYKSAMSLLDSSIYLAEAVHDNVGIANGYIALGNIKFNTHDYESARKLFESALEVARKNTLYKQMGVAIGNLARQPYESDIRKLMSMQKEALSCLEKVNGVEEEMAYILINMGNNQSANPDSALYYYKSALKLATNANIPSLLFGAYNNMAYSYLDKNDIASAEDCLKNQAIPAAVAARDNNWLSSLYDTYADVCVKKGNYKRALELQKLAMKARDADYRQKASDQVRLLAALLELKSKELIIQNEQKEILLQRNRLQKVELGLAIALLLVVGSVLTIFLLQLRNRARLQKEQIGSARRVIEMEETEKGRTARELHDLTGQLVLGISGTIENIDFPDPMIKEQIKTRIKELGASMRKISHRMNRAMIEHFTFNEMITGLCEDVQKLSGMPIDLDIEQEFPDMSNDLVMHFYRISQELLTNAGKYARESRLTMIVYTENDKLILFYSDKGPGFDPEARGKPSMGVMNIYERAKLVGGKATLKTAPGEGTSWEIVFPVNRKILS